MTKWQRYLLLILLLGSCKKPFEPVGALGNTGKYLVIDGVVKAGGDSTFIKLSRTKKFDTVIKVNPETNAQITVESDANAIYPLTEITPGNYAAAPMNLDITHKYRVRIKTSNGEEYLSDYVVVKNSPPIDSVGFVSKASGVQIYANTHDPANNTKYYRWEYTEAWKFHSTYESFYDGQDPRIYYVYYCYAKDTSSFIAIGTSAQLKNDVIYQAPIVLVPPSSEKIEIRYSINVEQFALTSDAYNFWTNLQKNSEANGSIFDAQPSDNQTNYRCLTNPGELVVGYLSVGSTATKRIFIDRSQLLASYNPKYAYADGCSIDTAKLADGSIALLSDTTNYTAIQGFFFSPFSPFGTPNAITYSTRDCADCTARGNTGPPPFWQ